MNGIKYCLTAWLMAFCVSLSAQKPYYTHECYDKKLIKEAKAWLKKGEWRQGFTAAEPHESVNIVDFYMQYKKNPEQWTKLFQYLAKTDLLSLPKGKHPIEEAISSSAWRTVRTDRWRNAIARAITTTSTSSIA